MQTSSFTLAAPAQRGYNLLSTLRTCRSHHQILSFLRPTLESLRPTAEAASALFASAPVSLPSLGVTSPVVVDGGVSDTPPGTLYQIQLSIF